MKEFEQSLQMTRTDFDIVKPVLKKIFENIMGCNCEFEQTESYEHPDDPKCDMRGGIDIWCICEKGMFGIASRIQYGKDWKTFTIRTQRSNGTVTQLQKRIRSLKNGSLAPAYVYQAYIVDDQLKSLALVQSKDLYINYFDMGGSYDYRSTFDRNGRQSFRIINWSDFVYAGFDLYEYRNGQVVKRSVNT